MTAPIPTPPSIAVDVPADWSVEEHVGPYALVARAPAEPGFVSNLTVAVAPYDPGQPSEVYLAAQVTNLTTTLVDVVVLDAVAERDPSQAFLVAAHAAADADLTVIQNHRLLPDGLAIIATVTSADIDWPDQVDELLALAASLHLSEPGLDRPDQDGPER